MPLAPPVTIATRPSSLPMTLFLPLRLAFVIHTRLPRKGGGWWRMSRVELPAGRPNLPATRSACPIWSALAAEALDKLGEGFELLPDEADRLLIGDLAGLGIDLLRAIADEDLRFVQSHRIEENHRTAEIVLHASAAEGAHGRRLEGDRLTGKRLIGYARHPVDRILQAARHGEIVFRRVED